MLYAIRDNDMITAVINYKDKNAIPLPPEFENVPLLQLRFDNGKIIKLDDDIRTYYIDNDGFLHIHKTNDQWQEIRCRWFDVVKFDNVSKQYKVFSTIFKEELIDEVKAYRQQLEDEGIEINGHTQTLNDSDISKITATGVLFIQKPDLVILWRFRDGYFMRLNAKHFQQLSTIVFQYIEALFATEHYHVSNILQLDDDKLSTYNYRTKWPKRTFTIEEL